MVRAVGFSLLAAFLFAAAAALQYRAARRVVRGGSDASAAQGLIRRLVREPVWLTGWGVNLAGFCAQATALHFGSTATVQPLLVSQLVFTIALVAVDGGPGTYWHPRANGDDPIGVIVDELLPRLRERGARTDRIGAIGWSMGGYGALVLARRLGAHRMAAVVASSPALFASYEDARAVNPRSFDGAADFARHDVFAASDELKGVPLRVDCGTSDPFAAMTRRFREKTRPEGALDGGCHDGAFWRSRLRAQLAFLGHRLGAADRPG